VERELKRMGDKDWKRLALERDKWKKIVEDQLVQVFVSGECK
jgi:hypothetical protein